MLHYKSEENHNGVNTQCHKNEIIIFRFVSICISVNGAEGEGNKIVIKKKAPQNHHKPEVPILTVFFTNSFLLVTFRPVIIQ